jgi:hypothetical protein
MLTNTRQGILINKKYIKIHFYKSSKKVIRLHLCLQSLGLAQKDSLLLLMT